MEDRADYGLQCSECGKTVGYLYPASSDPQCDGICYECGPAKEQEAARLTKPFEEHLHERLQTPGERWGYLQAALDEEDPDLLRMAVQDCINALRESTEKVAPNRSTREEEFERLRRAETPPTQARKVTARWWFERGVEFAERQHRICDQALRIIKDTIE